MSPGYKAGVWSEHTVTSCNSPDRLPSSFSKNWPSNVVSFPKNNSRVEFNSSGITIHIENLYGNNSHHIVESCFKSLAIAIREGIKIDPHNSENIPSTKGSLAGSY